MKTFGLNVLSLLHPRKFTVLVIALVGISVALTACGGGGSSGATSSEPTPPPQESVLMTGKLIPVVEGLSFSTPSEAGTTNAQGQFSYRTGETIAFNLGDTTLGEVDAASELSVFDLAQTPVITGTQNLLNAFSTPIIRSSGLDSTLAAPATPWRPFHLAMNRLFLLHNLDRDQDPANGVQINPVMADLFGDVSIRFNQNWREFRELLAIRKARVDGHAMGAFDAPLMQVSYPGILDAAYAAMGISPHIFNISKQYFFENSGIDYLYNDSNMLARRSGWKDSEYRYDEYDNMIWRQDECGIIYESSFDAMGNALSHSSPYSITTYEYDKYGSLVLQEEDRWMDGEINSYTSVELDDQGRPVRIEKEPGDGLPGILELIRYDDRGNRVRWERRWGVYTDIHMQRFDAKNQLIWRQAIDGSEGYSEREWEYDAQGRVIAASESRYVNDELTVSDYQMYNLRGDVLRWEHDRKGGDSFNVIRSWDDEGNETERAVDINADGTIDEITRWEYDVGGEVTVTKIDADADGTTDSVIPATTRFEYDGRGNRLLFETKDSSGRISWLTRYAYDDANNLTVEDEEIGFYELTTRYEYKPMGWKGIFFARSRVSEADFFDHYPCL